MSVNKLCAALGLGFCSLIGGGQINSASAAVQISAKPTQNMSCSGGMCSTTAKNAVLNVSDLTNMLASGDVVVESGSIAKDINIKAEFSWTSNQRLTLDANRSLLFEKAVVVAGTGALTIVTNDGGSGGDFSFASKGRVEFWDTTSALVINGSHYLLVSSMKRLVRYERQDNSGHYALAKNISAANRVYEATPMNRTFAGSFEGLGNSISNLTLQGTAANESVGLFGEYGPSGNGVIRDLHLKSVSVTATASGQNIGAVVGLMDVGTVANVDVSGTVSASGMNSIVGGAVGLSIMSTVRGSASHASVSGTNGAAAAGGLIGEDSDGCPHCIGLLDSNYATGAVSGGDATAVGGLIGENLGVNLSNSYALGAVSGGNNASVGGLAGINGESNLSGFPSIATSYSTGTVSGGSGASVGGFVGQDQVSSSISDAYWDLDASGVSDPSRGAGNVANDPGIEGLTNSELTSALPTGFDPKFWSQSPGVNGGYPYLSSVPIQ